MPTEFNNNEPKIDIILPNYNKSEFLEETINSIFLQTYKNWNLLIIDDHSIDSSKNIINKFKDRNNKVAAIFLQKNKGVSFCRNLGIRSSNSKYIAFIDSDDYWDKNKLESQIIFMEKFDHKFTYTNYTPFIVKNNKKFFKKTVIARNSFNYNQFINDTSIAMSSVILRRSIVGKTKFQKLKICEDYFFKCEMLKKCNYAVKLNENTMFYRISKNSLQSNKLRNLRWVWHINKKYNQLSIYKNLKSLFFITMSSIKRYGIK